MPDHGWHKEEGSFQGTACAFVCEGCDDGLHSVWLISCLIILLITSISGLRNQNNNYSLIKLQDVNDKAAAEWYLGKRVAYIYKVCSLQTDSPLLRRWLRLRTLLTAPSIAAFGARWPALTAQTAWCAYHSATTSQPRLSVVPSAVCCTPAWCKLLWNKWCCVQNFWTISWIERIVRVHLLPFLIGFHNSVA